RVAPDADVHGRALRLDAVVEAGAVDEVLVDVDVAALALRQRVFRPVAHAILETTGDRVAVDGGPGAGAPGHDAGDRHLLRHLGVAVNLVVAHDGVRRAIAQVHRALETLEVAGDIAGRLDQPVILDVDVVRVIDVQQRGGAVADLQP